MGQTTKPRLGARLHFFSTRPPVWQAKCPQHPREVARGHQGQVEAGIVFYCKPYGHYFTAKPVDGRP